MDRDNHGWRGSGWWRRSENPLVVMETEYLLTDVMQRDVLWGSRKMQFIGRVFNIFILIKRK